MYSQELYDKRQLFTDSIEFKKPQRIPHFSTFFTWKVYDSQYSMKNALYDFGKMKKVVVQFHERYHFDAYMDLGARNMFAITDPLGGGTHRFDPVSESIYALDDKCMLNGDELLEYAQDSARWRKILFQRRYPTLTIKQLMDSETGMMKYGQFRLQIEELFKSKYATPLYSSFQFQLPHETYQNLRGIKGLALDMRRNKGLVKEAFETNFKNDTIALISGVLKGDSSANFVDHSLPMLSHISLSVKQFEEFYWPYMKYALEETFKAGRKVYIYAEGSVLRFSDMFRDIPKGNAALHLELDDIFETRKKIPNLCLAGGMSSVLLGTGTPEDNVAFAKKLIDTMGEGYIFSEDKMMSFRNDCRRENLLAVCDYISKN